MDPWDIVSIRLSPQMDWSKWCTPTTAGPKKTPCADSKTTYYNKGRLKVLSHYKNYLIHCAIYRGSVPVHM